MVRDFSTFKLNEAIRPSLSPGTMRGIGVGGFGMGLVTSQPKFQDLQGNVIATIACGGAYTFDVPGYSQVWLQLTRDGATVYDGLFTVPMAAYTSSCFSDPGHYVAVVSDSHTRQEIGRTAFDVTGSALSSPAVWLLAGAALLFWMRRKRS